MRASAVRRQQPPHPIPGIKPVSFWGWCATSQARMQRVVAHRLVRVHQWFAAHSMLNLVTRGLSARMLRYSLQGGWEEGRLQGAAGWLVGWELTGMPGHVDARQQCRLQPVPMDGCNTLSRSPVDGGLVGRVVPQLLFCVLVVHVVAHTNELLRRVSDSSGNLGSSSRGRAPSMHITAQTRTATHFACRCASTAGLTRALHNGQPITLLPSPAHLLPVAAGQQDDGHTHNVIGWDAAELGRVRLRV